MSRRAYRRLLDLIFIAVSACSRRILFLVETVGACSRDTLVDAGRFALVLAATGAASLVAFALLARVLYAGALLMVAAWFVADLRCLRLRRYADIG